MCLPFPLEVCTHFPWIQIIFMAIIFWSPQHVSCTLQIISCNGFARLEKEPSSTVRYHIVFWSYILYQQFSHCYRLTDSMRCNCIILFLHVDSCYQQVISINVRGSRYWNTYHTQLISDCLQCFHSNLYGNKFCTSHWCFYGRLLLRITIN